MINIGVVCDSTWDNFVLIDKKFKKLNNEIFRIHALYGKTLEILTNCANKNDLSLIRHYSENLCNTITNMLKVCDIWLIFTNCIEYLTSSSLIFSKCKEYNIKFIIIGEFNIENNHYSFEFDKKSSFKKIINTIEKKENIPINPFESISKKYNDNFQFKQFVPIAITSEMKNKIKTIYDNLAEDKKSKSIKLLYDKDEIKREKQMKKTMKEVNQLQFMNNRLSYYKK